MIISAIDTGSVGLVTETCLTETENNALYIDNFLKQERIVVGSSSERVTKLIKKLYKPFVQSVNQIEYTKNKYEITKKADALIICIEWSTFRILDFK